MSYGSLKERAQKYGISVETLVEMLKGVCRICGAKPARGLVIDHCHRTGVVRGPVCQPCNTMIGFIERAQRMDLFDRILDHLEQAPLEDKKHDAAFERAKKAKLALKEESKQQEMLELYAELIPYSIQTNPGRIVDRCDALGFCPVRHEYANKDDRVRDDYIKQWWYNYCKKEARLFVWAKPHAGGLWELHFDTMELKYGGREEGYANLTGKGLLEVYALAERIRIDRKRHFKDWPKYDLKTDQFTRPKESWSVGSLGDLRTVELGEVVQALRRCNRVLRPISVRKTGPKAA